MITRLGASFSMIGDKFVDIALETCNILDVAMIG